MKINKKPVTKLKLALFGAVSFSALVLPLSIAAACGAVSETSGSIKFDNQVFNSVGELSNYATQKMTRVSVPFGQQRWMMHDGTANRFFNDPTEVNNFVRNNYITQRQTYVDQSFYDQLDNGRINNYALTNNANDISRVYQGHNDQIFSTAAAARESLLQSHEAYYYDNQYFASKADVNSYLRSDRFNARQVVDSSNVLTARRTDPVTKAAQDTQSLPAATRQTTSDQTFNNFVRSQAETVYQGANKTLNELSPLDVRLSDIPYLRQHNNQGRGSYIVDLKNTVDGYLVGPYVLNGALDPTSTILQSNQWKSSSTDYSKTSYQERLEAVSLDALISIGLASQSSYADFTSILTANLNEGATNQAFLASSSAKTKQPGTNEAATAEANLAANDGSKLAAALSRYQVNVPGQTTKQSLLAALANAEATLASGKSYGYFKALPTLRSWLLNQIVQADLPSSLVAEVNAQFDKVARYVNYLVHDLLDPVLSENAQSYNLASVFDFNNNHGYGEDPTVYLNNMHEGKVLTGAFDVATGVPGESAKVAQPEVKEILLAAPLVIGVLDYYSRRTTSIEKRLADRAAYVRTASNNATLDSELPLLTYDLPRDLSSLDNAAKVQPELAVLKAWSDHVKAFEANDLTASNALRTSDAQYQAFKATANLYLTYMNSFTNGLKVNSNSGWNQGSFNTAFDEALNRPTEAQSTQAQQLIQGALQATNLIKRGVTAVLASLKRANSVMLTFAQGTYQASLQLVNVTKSLATFAKLAKFLVAAAVFFEALNIMMGLIGHVVTDTYEYDYNRGERHYYWNGGEHREHSFLGFKWSSNTKSMPNNALINPLTIINPTTSDQYYYNGYKFNSELDLRQQFINDLRNGLYPELTQKQISLVKSNNQVQVFKAATTDALVSSVQEALKAPTGNTLKTSVFLSSRGFVYNWEQAKDAAIADILARLLPLRVVQLPRFNAGGNLERSSFLLPASAATPLYGAPANIDYSEVANNTYLTFNPNVRGSGSGVTTATPLTATEQEAVIEREFNNRFSLKHKDVLTSALAKTNRFSNLNSVLNLQNSGTAATYAPITIFSVTTPLGNTQHFANEGSALGYALKELNFSVLVGNANNEALIINNVVYASLSEFITRVLAAQTEGGN